jgi:hypothetical protein
MDIQEYYLYSLIEKYLQATSLKVEIKNWASGWAQYKATYLGAVRSDNKVFAIEYNIGVWERPNRDNVLVPYYFKDKEIFIKYLSDRLERDMEQL